MYNWRKHGIIASKQLACGGNEMRKKVERIVLFVIICFVVFKVLIFSQDVCEKATTMSYAHYDELEMLLQEDVR